MRITIICLLLGVSQYLYKCTSVFVLEMEGYSGYPPQQQPAYPPQQGYPSHVQPGYPPQQGYPPQEGYKDVPPPYYQPPQQQPYPQAAPVAPTAQQQSSTNVVVVSAQPTPVLSQTVIRPTGDHYLTLSIVLTFLCFFCGTWYSLFCTIPAIIFAISARDAEARGDLEGAQSKARVALILNIVSIVSWVIIFIILVIAISVPTTTASNCYYYTYSYRYYSYYYYSYRYSYSTSSYC